MKPVRDEERSGRSRFQVDPARIEKRLAELSRIGRDPAGGVTRLGFSDADRRAREWVTARMTQAGLAVRVDAAANLFGRREGSDPNLPCLLFGSHIDTVPHGGDFDGALGSLGALEVMTALAEAEAVTRHPMEMVIWADEEGVHFGQGLFGSRAAGVGIEPGELDLMDAEGVSLAEWLRRYGGDPETIDSARLDASRYAAYLELHIEQGPSLHRSGEQIGVVEGIVGIQRFAARIEGFANHAGTTRMEERRDALVAAADLTRAVREEVMARSGRQVGNVGAMKVHPGAPNVVPGLVEMPIELRDLDEAVIADMIARIRERGRAIARERNVSIRIEPFAREAPAPTDPRLRDRIEETALGLGFSTRRMPSGAGHDAQSVARSGIPIGMIFVPSKDGVSHAPSEWTSPEDCARGVELLHRVVMELDRRETT